MSIAEPEANESFIAEFLDDYFAESEEHLILLRRDLLALEESVGAPQLDRNLLDGLFRSFHSLKGISGMVGLRAAEDLAHHMESYLRALRQGDTALTDRGMDGLIAGTRRLEEVISARRHQSSPPDIAPVITQLQELVGGADDTHEPVREPESIVAPSTSGRSPEVGREGKEASLWRFEFTPLPALSERGININLVRSRLQKIGELRNAAPRVLPGGGIAFDFIVASGAPEADFAPLREFGITYERCEESAAAAEPVPSDVAAPAPSTTSVVRVGLGRLDELMRMVGELVISRARLDENLRQVESAMPVPEWRALQETSVLIDRQLRDLREGVMRVRMVPVGEIFDRMRFVVRDLARDYRKAIRLDVKGQETEIDKLLIERMMDPLMHLVRNAISHGLETREEREALGKPAEGTISLRAATSAEMVIIEVEDDGRGMDREQIAARARQIGILDVGERLDDAALLELICSPGFSTREEADRASGRGVGMAVVKNTVLGLGGDFELDSEVGRGSRFTIRLPVTVLIADALIVSLGGQRFAVPQSSVREVFEVEAASVKAFENNEVLHHRGAVLPLIRLARLFGLPATAARTFHAFVVGSGLNAVGLAVDQVVGLREIVVRTTTDPLLQVTGIAGATELGDGRAVLILDPFGLVRASSEKRRCVGS